MAFKCPCFRKYHHTKSTYSYHKKAHSHIITSLCWFCSGGFIFDFSAATLAYSCSPLLQCIINNMILQPELNYSWSCHLDDDRSCVDLFTAVGLCSACIAPWTHLIVFQTHFAHSICSRNLNKFTMKCSYLEKKTTTAKSFWVICLSQVEVKSQVNDQVKVESSLSVCQANHKSSNVKLETSQVTWVSHLC